MLVTTEPHKRIKHPDFGDRIVQNGMLFFMDGSPMGLPENYRVEKARPAASGGQAQTKRQPGAGTTSATATPPGPVTTSTSVAMSNVNAPESTPTAGDELQAAIQSGKFFTLKAYMRKAFNIDPRNKDEAMAWLRDNGKLAA